DELTSPGADRSVELGDLLAAAVALARHLDVDPERALRLAAAKFRSRFEATLGLASERGLDPEGLDPAAWLDLWEDAKRAEPPGGDGGERR
ncbi:MAG: nucleoside triphosphate pyrophosphohydrolase, partial [Nitriliruptorales bacterium]